MSYEKRLDELVKPEWLTEEQWKLTLQTVESTERIKRDAKAHVELYQRTGGKEGYELAGAPVLLLTTIGRKSGNQVTTPLNFLEQSEGYVVVGSLAGVADDPQWAKNLKQNLLAWVQIKDQKWPADIREVGSDEQDSLWPILVKTMPLWEVFAQRTDRKFPIFLITQKKQD